MPDSDALPVSDEEIALLRELTNAGVPFILVGPGAAVLQGADAVTKDLVLWFRSIAEPGLVEAAQKVGAAFVWRNNPPLFSGPGLDDIDVVLKCDGLRDFDSEYQGAIDLALVPGLVRRSFPSTACSRVNEPRIGPRIVRSSRPLKQQSRRSRSRLGADSRHAR